MRRIVCPHGPRPVASLPGGLGPGLPRPDLAPQAREGVVSVDRMRGRVYSLPCAKRGGGLGRGQGATKSRKRLIARSVVRGSDYPQTSITRMCAEWIPAFAGITHSLRRRVAVVGVALDSIYITDRTRMNDAAIIATVRQYFSRRAQNVVTAYVFGSVGKGLSGLSSDVDIAVLYALAPIPAVSGSTSSMQAELEALLGRPVDLIVLNDAPVDLVHRVLRDGAMARWCARQTVARASNSKSPRAGNTWICCRSCAATVRLPEP